MSNLKKEIQIGEVVYVLSNKTQTIVPALVVEETIVNTLQGKKTTWKFAIGPDGPKRKVVDSTSLNGEMFSSLEEVENFLKTRLTKFIDKAVSDAKKNENFWYKKIKDQNKQEIKKTNTNNEKLDPESFLSDFGDSPQEPFTQEEHFQKNMQQISHEEQQEKLKQQLREKIAPSREELQTEVQPEPESVRFDPGSENMNFKPGTEDVKIRSITGPGGEKIPVEFKV